MKGKLDSRKLWFCVGACFLFYVGFGFGKISEAGLLDAVKWIVGIYCGANVAEAATKKPSGALLDDGGSVK